MICATLLQPSLEVAFSLFAVTFAESLSETTGAGDICSYTNEGHIYSVIVSVVTNLLLILSAVLLSFSDFASSVRSVTTPSLFPFFSLSLFEVFFMFSVSCSV